MDGCVSRIPTTADCEKSANSAERSGARHSLNRSRTAERASLNEPHSRQMRAGWNSVGAVVSPHVGAVALDRQVASALFVEVTVIPALKRSGAGKKRIMCGGNVLLRGVPTLGIADDIAGSYGTMRGGHTTLTILCAELFEELAQSRIDGRRPSTELTEVLDELDSRYGPLTSHGPVDCHLWRQICASSASAGTRTPTHPRCRDISWAGSRYLVKSVPGGV